LRFSFSRCGTSWLRVGKLRAVMVRCALFLMMMVFSGTALAAPKITLKFKSDRPFKIVQFSDIQDDEMLDPRTASAMGRILDSEKPDLVILTGDNVSTGETQTLAELKSAIEQIARPMEARKVPWAIVFGNHDTDGLGKIGIDKAQMFEIYRAYPHNINPKDPPGVYGSGNGLLKILGPGNKPAFGIWLLDSNAYVKQDFGGQKLDTYDWIRSSQIEWYLRESRLAEKESGFKLPSLMFFHICLPEFALMAATTKTVGERNENECPSSINSGMFATLLDRGDVLGVYVGHDHVNTYEGSWYGIRLGYGGNIGYGTYGLPGNEEQKHRLRGARVFEIDPKNLKAYKSRYLLASEVK